MGDPVELNNRLVTHQPLDLSLNEVAPHSVGAGLQGGGSPLRFSDLAFQLPREQRGLDLAAKFPECEGALGVERVLERVGAREMLPREQICRLVLTHPIRANGSLENSR